jgi:hypothetical protein
VDGLDRRSELAYPDTWRFFGNFGGGIIFFCLFLFEGDGPVCIDEQAKERKRQVFFAAKVGIVAVFLDG